MAVGLNARGGHFVFNTAIEESLSKCWSLCLNARGGHFVFNTSYLQIIVNFQLVPVLMPEVGILFLIHWYDTSELEQNESS